MTDLENTSSSSPTLPDSMPAVEASTTADAGPGEPAPWPKHGGEPNDAPVKQYTREAYNAKGKRVGTVHVRVYGEVPSQAQIEATFPALATLWRLAQEERDTRANGVVDTAT